MSDTEELKPANLRKLVTFTPEMAARIDEYRWGNRIGSESEAIRRLIALGLSEIGKGNSHER